MKGLLLTLTNPKPILFFGTFFPLFIDASVASTTRSFYLLGAAFEVMNLAYFSLLVALIGRTTTRQRVLRIGKLTANQVAGIGLLICSAAIVLA